MFVLPARYLCTCISKWSTSCCLTPRPGSVPPGSSRSPQGTFWGSTAPFSIEMPHQSIEVDLLTETSPSNHVDDVGIVASPNVQKDHCILKWFDWASCSCGPISLLAPFLAWSNPNDNHPRLLHFAVPCPCRSTGQWSSNPRSCFHCHQC